jgi:hypothetical protein
MALLGGKAFTSTARPSCPARAGRVPGDATAALIGEWAPGEAAARRNARARAIARRTAPGLQRACMHPLAGTVVVRAAAAAQRDPKKRVVITGIGCCTVFGNDPDEFYNRRVGPSHPF